MPGKKHKNYFIPYVVSLGLFVIATIALACVAETLCIERNAPPVVEYIEVTPEPTISPEEVVHVVNLSAKETDAMSYNTQDVELLAKIMVAESGPFWPDWTTMMVGEVVLNRVKSPEFPNTVHDVIYQSNPVQYSPVFSRGWDSMEVSEHDVELATRLLEGERPIGDPSMVFQALFEQGNQTLVAFYDTYLGTTTYFCTAYNQELYQSE